MFGGINQTTIMNNQYEYMVSIMRFTIILLFFIPIGLHAQVSSGIDETKLSNIDNNNGFQDYKFGDSMNNYPNCSFETVEDGGAERCFINRNHFINDIKANNIALYFINSELSKIRVYFDHDLYGQLRKAVTAAFGGQTRARDEIRDLLDPDREIETTGIGAISRTKVGADRDLDHEKRISSSNQRSNSNLNYNNDSSDSYYFHEDENRSIWKADRITLNLIHVPEDRSDRFEPQRGYLFLEYKLNDYDERLQNYRSGKYSPSDF